MIHREYTITANVWASDDRYSFLPAFSVFASNMEDAMAIAKGVLNPFGTMWRFTFTARNGSEYSEYISSPSPLTV